MMEDSKIWVGLFGVIPHSRSELLNGRKGAYVNILALADDRAHFINRVSKKLNEMGFSLVEMEDIETVQNRKQKNKLGGEVLMMLNSLDSPNSLVLGTFYTFDHDDA